VVGASRRRDVYMSNCLTVLIVDVKYAGGGEGR
jgi:hypothetical protein